MIISQREQVAQGKRWYQSPLSRKRIASNCTFLQQADNNVSCNFELSLAVTILANILRINQRVYFLHDIFGIMYRICLWDLYIYSSCLYVNIPVSTYILCCRGSTKPFHKAVLTSACLASVDCFSLAAGLAIPTVNHGVFLQKLMQSWHIASHNYLH